MDNLGVKVEYIFHSGFTLETKNHFLVFDYFKGDLKLPDKKTYIFVTHGHEDHYNPEILDLEGDIEYIFSEDFKDEIDMESRKNIDFMRPYKSIQVDDLEIKSFSSTDLGLSLLIKVDELNIFFAGDLNWWSWNSDTEEERKDMEYLFKKKIGRIEGEAVDIAFFPVDPRLEENYALGGEYFIEKFHPKYFFPMHFGDNYSMNKDFIHKTKDLDTKIVDIEHKNQIFEL